MGSFLHAAPQLQEIDDTKSCPLSTKSRRHIPVCSSSLSRPRKLWAAHNLAHTVGHSCKSHSILLSQIHRLPRWWTRGRSLESRGGSCWHGAVARPSCLGRPWQYPTVASWAISPSSGEYQNVLGWPWSASWTSGKKDSRNLSSTSKTSRPPCLPSSCAPQWEMIAGYVSQPLTGSFPHDHASNHICQVSNNPRVSSKYLILFSCISLFLSQVSLDICIEPFDKVYLCALWTRKIQCQNRQSLSHLGGPCDSGFSWPLFNKHNPINDKPILYYISTHFSSCGGVESPALCWHWDPGHWSKTRNPSLDWKNS